MVPMRDSASQSASIPEFAGFPHPAARGYPRGEPRYVWYVTCSPREPSEPRYAPAGKLYLNDVKASLAPAQIVQSASSSCFTPAAQESADTPHHPHGVGTGPMLSTALSVDSHCIITLN